MPLLYAASNCKSKFSLPTCSSAIFVDDNCYGTVPECHQSKVLLHHVGAVVITGTTLASAVLATGRWLAVCLSHAGIVSKWLNLS